MPISPCLAPIYSVVIAIYRNADVLTTFVHIYLMNDLWQENIVEDEMIIDQRHHRHFVARKGELLRQITEECGGVSVSFPRFGVKSDKVVLKGPAECVKAAKTRISDIVLDLVR